MFKADTKVSNVSVTMKIVTNCIAQYFSLFKFWSS